MGVITEGDVEDEKRVGVFDVWRAGPSEVRHLARRRGERETARVWVRVGNMGGGRKGRTNIPLRSVRDRWAGSGRICLRPVSTDLVYKLWTTTCLFYSYSSLLVLGTNFYVLLIRLIRRIRKVKILTLYKVFFENIEEKIEKITFGGFS